MTDALTKIADEAARVQLSEATRDVLDTFDKSIDLVFDRSMETIKKTREMCDMAEASIASRRKAVKEAMTSYIEALQVSANTTDQAQKAISELLVQGDRL